jgi:hypothetical protein
MVVNVPVDRLRRLGDASLTSADGWTSPDDDLGGRRMSIVRQLVNEVSFEKRSGEPRLRFKKLL